MEGGGGGGREEGGGEGVLYITLKKVPLNTYTTKIVRREPFFTFLTILYNVLRLFYLHYQLRIKSEGKCVIPIAQLGRRPSSNSGDGLPAILGLHQT